MILDELYESPQACPECGGPSFSDLILAEKKDACYHKVKATAKVWPSAYASGRLVQCRKKGAANWGNKSEGVAEGLNEMDKSAPQPGRDGKVSQSTYGSRDKKGSDYFKGTEAPGKAITAKQASKDALDILKKQGVAEGLDDDESVLSHFAEVLADELGYDPDEVAENIVSEMTTPSGVEVYSFTDDDQTYYMGVLRRGKGSAIVSVSHAGGGQDNELEIYGPGENLKYVVKYGRTAPTLHTPDNKAIAQAKPGQDENDLVGVALDILWGRMQQRYTAQGVAEGEKINTQDLEFRTRRKDNIMDIYAELDGVMVGYAKFNIRNNTLVAGKVSVDPDHRRQGIATAIYDYAEKQGYTIMPSQSQTELGQQFWQDREQKQGVAEGLNEFAPAGVGTPPRGPRTPGGDPWGSDDSGEDSYGTPKPRHYARSSSYFEQFEADHFDDEVFDKATGTFKGYWDDAEGRIQIAYFKFDDPTQTGGDDPGMGWYYEPVDEGYEDDDEGELCHMCAGTGEGRHESETCDHCHGTGYEPTEDHDWYADWSPEENVRDRYDEANEPDADAEQYREARDDQKIAGRYDPDDFDDMVNRLRQRAEKQEKERGPVDLAKLAQRLRDIEHKQDRK